jgi:hypothetical protein
MYHASDWSQLAITNRLIRSGRLNRTRSFCLQLKFGGSERKRAILVSGSGRPPAANRR